MVARGFYAIGVELFLRKYGYSKVIHGGLCKETATPMALCHANHALTQGSLHYRLATQGYRKRNTDGVGMFILQYN